MAIPVRFEVKSRGYGQEQRNPGSTRMGAAGESLAGGFHEIPLLRGLSPNDFGFWTSQRHDSNRTGW